MEKEKEISIIEIFKMGIDYGQLLAERERVGEELFDGFQAVLVDHKYSMPSQPAERRRVYSEKWFNAKRQSLLDFLELLLLQKEGLLQIIK